VYRRLKNWLAKPDAAPEQRSAPRISRPPVVVFHWDGSTPASRHLRDISLTGAYLYTSERWYPGTVVRLLIQGTNPGDQIAVPDEVEGVDVAGDEAEWGGKARPPSNSISLQARVVYHGKDGMALEFLFGGPGDRKLLEELIAGAPKNTSLQPSLAGGGTA
jgi:hypothetical protein